MIGNRRLIFSRAPMPVGAFAITGASFAFLAYTRSVCAAYFCGAALCCALSVKVIKKIVKQPRPLGATQLKSYGYELYSGLSAFVYCSRHSLKPFTYRF